MRRSFGEGESREGASMKRDRSTVLAFITVLAVTIGVVCLPAAAMADDLFVSSLGNNSVLEYNGTTGAFVRAFVPAGNGGLNRHIGLNFEPYDSLFVISVDITRVHV